METAAASDDDGNVAGNVLSLEIFAKDPSFDLKKAVCSHGLFMMAPNHWDPASSTLHRPLRIPSGVVRASISHRNPSGPVVVSVARTAPLSSSDEKVLLDQVKRMLRISDDNDRIVQEFHRIHADSRERGFGRIFRSPTLFEDMVKCILLCNCQWPRTLSMAKALCELHLQTNSKNPEDFHPKTPQNVQHKRRKGIKRKKTTGEESSVLMIDQDPELAAIHFPTPEELAALDAGFLATRCKLGYRAKHIVSLAQSIVDGKVQLEKLEELSSYESIDEQLSALRGFGPFTRANVLMCMGFYDKVPADTETLRHIRQGLRSSVCSGGRRSHLWGVRSIPVLGILV